MKCKDESYADFEDSIFREIHDRKTRYVANELIRLALKAGISQDELIQIIRSSTDENGDEILSALNARIENRSKKNP